MPEIVNLFGLQPIENNEEKILKKISSPQKVSKKKKSPSKLTKEEKFMYIESEVNRILGSYKDNTITIYSKDELHSYIDKAISNDIIAVDTETNNSLQPIECKIMGLCLYTPGEKNAYIPINHINIETGDRLDTQLTENDIAEELLRLNNTKIIFHNAKFDYQVIKCTCGVELEVYWDTLIGARVLNENEHANLKEQYIIHIDPFVEKYSIEQLFKGELYEVFSPELFSLYAATDSYMTYKLYLYQAEQFSKKDNAKVFELFKDIEIPVIVPTAEMELNGVCLDADYTERLSAKYHKMLEDTISQLSNEEKKYAQVISQWRLTPEAQFKKKKDSLDKKGNEQFEKSLSEKLETPINFDSPTQVAIFLYDVLKIKPVNKKSPRSTNKDDLDTIVKNNPDLTIMKLVVKKKHISKILDTYVDKLPTCICSDGKVHASFNQYGADTGRYSSNNPNLQNIPSRGDEKTLRVMFKASPGHIMLGSDFSAQEPRIFATFSQDETMLNAYETGKDLYAVIASKVYSNNYEDNLEFLSDGTPYKEGKKRRTAAKSILLGLLYGRGAASIAEQIGSTKDEAQSIIDEFYKQFPKAYTWINETIENCRHTGYVEDLWGRRRRLDDILKERYKVSSTKSVKKFNPLLYTSGVVSMENLELIETYKNRLSRARYKNEIDKIISDGKLDGVSIRDNTGYVSRAERQCVNARVQGSAASMSKKAIISLYNNKEIKDLGFKLLIMVHDELIGECPVENVGRVKELLSEIMSEAGKPEVSLPMNCDVAVFDHWYIDECEDTIHEKFEDMVSSGINKDNAISELYNHYNEFTQKQIEKFCIK